MKLKIMSVGNDKRAFEDTAQTVLPPPQVGTKWNLKTTEVQKVVLSPIDSSK